MRKVIKKAKVKSAPKSKIPYAVALEKSQLKHFDIIEKKLWFSKFEKTHDKD